MNQQQLDYLEGMEKGFKEKANEAREKLKILHYFCDGTSMEFYADAMDTCVELVKQIRSDLDRLEKGDAESYEQETS